STMGAMAVPAPSLLSPGAGLASMTSSLGGASSSPTMLQCYTCLSSGRPLRRQKGFRLLTSQATCLAPKGVGGVVDHVAELLLVDFEHTDLPLVEDFAAKHVTLHEDGLAVASSSDAESRARS